MKPGDWRWGGGSSVYKDWEAGRKESEGEERALGEGGWEGQQKRSQETDH